MPRHNVTSHQVLSQCHVTTPRHHASSQCHVSPHPITTSHHNALSCHVMSRHVSWHVSSRRLTTFHHNALSQSPIEMSLDHITPKCHVTSRHVSSHHRRVTTPRHKLKSRCLDTQLSSQRLITTTRYNVSSHRHVASCQVPSRLITSPRHVKFRHVSI